MHGPPGAGKTLLAEAIAGESGVKILVFSSNFVIQPTGSGAAGIRKMLVAAEAVVEKEGKVLIFIDEIETVARRRVRGGRFGFQIEMDLPDLVGRVEIFKALIRRLK